ncbi:MAG: dihydroorotate dehydrogenase electron transfer subunit [Anaerolineae bacterium]|nr:dihydroorotate dehydrogenase electron transfer subunit [Anaerolineae bacterium]
MYQTYVVAETRDENARTRTLVLDGALLSEPGQFVMAWLPSIGEKPYSIAAADPLALMVVAVGPFSEALHALEVGDRVWIRGPLGQGFRLPDEPAGKRLLLVGGGYGVAPLLYLASEARAAGATVEVCIGARTAEDLLLAGAFRRLGCTTHLSTEDGSAGYRGLVTDLALGAMTLSSPDAVYACGPVPMLEAVEMLSRCHGLPHQLSWEARMRCGMGLCGECEVHGRDVDGWLACRDGPVSRG